MTKAKNKLASDKRKGVAPALSQKAKENTDGLIRCMLAENEEIDYYQENNVPYIENQPLSGKDWLRFKATFVEEYGGEPVNPSSGFTPSEFLEFFKSGYIEGNEQWYNKREFYPLIDLPEDEE